MVTTTAVQPSPSVTNTTVARRADEQGITKAEARALLKEEARQAAIRSASGEVLALPSVVDRAGNVLPVTLEQAAAVVRAALDRAGALTVDVETSGYPVDHQNYELRSVQLGDEHAAVVFHPVDHTALVRALLAEAPRLHAHSATADLVPLAHAGLLGDGEAGIEGAWERMHDTVIPAKLADPASTGSDPGLKQLSGTVLGGYAVSPASEQGRKAVFKAGKWLEDTDIDTPIERSGWAQIETGSVAMLRYSASDVLDTAALPRVLPMPAPEVYERERLAQRMTARITHRGVPLDYAHITAMSEPHRVGRTAAAEKIRSFGVANPGSDKQIADVAMSLGATLPRTAKGNVSVARDALDPFKEAAGALGEFVGAVLEYRGHAKALSTYLDPYRLMCEQGDGRARPTIYTLGADTGRMSSVRPNFQNIPREGGFRASVISDPGYTMIGADFSGVEIRFAAALSQDPTLLAFIAAEDAFNADVAARAQADGTSAKQARAAILAERGLKNAGEGDGLHWVIARQIWGDDATKAHRYIAKRGVFGDMYGGGIPALAAQVGVAHDVMQSVVDTLGQITPGLKAWSEQIRQAVRSGHTKFQSYSGRVIHLPRERPHAAPNYAIQGSAREVLIDALVKWRQTKWGDCTLLPVHDELDVWVPAEDAEEATAELIRCMETELYGVPIVSEPSKPSTYWRDST